MILIDLGERGKVMKLVRVFSQCQTIFSGFRGLVPRCEACFVAEETARYHSGYLVTQTKCHGIGSTKDTSQGTQEPGPVATVIRATTAPPCRSCRHLGNTQNERGPKCSMDSTERERPSKGILSIYNGRETESKKTIPCPR